MSRRGWVSAEDAAGDRWRLAVFDDGWVELPGSARGLSDTRSQLTQLLVLVGAFGVLVLLSQLAGRFDGVGPGVSVVFAVGALALLLFSAVQIARARARDRQRGAPLLRRAHSSAQYASRVDGVRRIGAEQVGAVLLAGPEHPGPADPLVVSVLLHDGTTLTYRTPDATARRVFAPWASLT